MTRENLVRLVRESASELRRLVDASILSVCDFDLALLLELELAVVEIDQEGAR